MGIDDHLEEKFAEAYNGKNVRHSGRTTRLADKYIQDLYRDGFVVIRDHYDGERQHRALYLRIYKRIHEEFIYDVFEFDPNTYTIKLKHKYHG